MKVFGTDANKYINNNPENCLRWNSSFDFYFH